MIPPKKRKYPSQDYEKDKIVPAITLAEKHIMHLNDDMFEAMEKGKKCIECRLYDKKRMMIDKGDYIEFVGGKGSLLMRVIDRHINDSDEYKFKKLFRYFTDIKQSPYSAESFGFDDADAFEKAMCEIYGDKVQQYSAVAFVLEKAEPIYYAEINVFTDQWFEFLNDEWGLTAEEKEKLDSKILTNKCKITRYCKKN